MILHNSDILNNPAMFKINNNSHEWRLICSLLIGQRLYSSAQLSANRNAEKALELNDFEDATEVDKEIEIGKYYVAFISK